MIIIFTRKISYQIHLEKLLALKTKGKNGHPPPHPDDSCLFVYCGIQSFTQRKPTVLIFLQKQIYRLLRTALVAAGGSGPNVVKSVVKENRSKNEGVQRAARRE